MNINLSILRIDPTTFTCWIFFSLHILHHILRLYFLRFPLHPSLWVYQLYLFYPKVYPALKFIIAFTTRPTGLPLLPFCKHLLICWMYLLILLLRRTFWCRHLWAASGIALLPLPGWASLWLLFALSTLSSLRQAKYTERTLRRVQFHVSPFHLLRDIIAWGFTSQVYLLWRWIPDGTIRTT